MRRFLATVAITVIGTTMIGAGTALAADLEITPDAPAEGDAELTIEIGDFSPETPVYAVPCEVPAEGEELDVGTDSCDVSEVVTVTTDGNGNATIVVNWNIPPEGVAVYVGDQARDNQATMIVSPPDATGAAEEEPEVAVLGTTVVQEDPVDDLADTGPREVMLLVLLAAIVIGVGTALRGAERLRTPG